MKKKIILSVLIIALLLTGFCLYMDTHYVVTVLEDVEMTEDEILKEMPEIAMTEADLALKEYVMALPEVKTILAQGESAGSEDFEGYAFPMEEAAALLAAGEAWDEAAALFK